MLNIKQHFINSNNIAAPDFRSPPKMGARASTGDRLNQRIKIMRIIVLIRTVMGQNHKRMGIADLCKCQSCIQPTAQNGPSTEPQNLMQCTKKQRNNLIGAALISRNKREPLPYAESTMEQSNNDALHIKSVGPKSNLTKQILSLDNGKESLNSGSRMEKGRRKL